MSRNSCTNRSRNVRCFAIAHPTRSKNHGTGRRPAAPRSAPPAGLTFDSLRVDQAVEDRDVRPRLRQQPRPHQVLTLLVGGVVLQETLILLDAVLLALLEGLEGGGDAEDLGRSFDELGPRPPGAGAVRRLA